MPSLIEKVGRIFSNTNGREDYKPVQTDEVEQEGAQSTAYSLSLTEDTERERVKEQYSDSQDPEAAVGLLSDEARQDDPEKERPHWSKEKNRLRFCCDLNRSLILKISGLLGLIIFLLAAYELLKSAFHKPEHVLEGLPAFGTSLGCLSAPYLYNGTKHTLRVPMTTVQHDHAFEMRGGAVGTITLLEEQGDSNEVRYEVMLRSNDEDILQQSSLSFPKKDETGEIQESVLVLSTPYLPKDKPDVCMRYDIKVFIPRSLRKFHLVSHAAAHVKFAQDAHISLDDLFVILYALDPRNIIQTSTNIDATEMSLEVYRGWIVGDVSLVGETSIITQRSDGVAHVGIHPVPPTNPTDPEVASLRTVTGVGKTEIFFGKGADAGRRPIDATHISSKNGDLVLMYQSVGFDGLVRMDAKNYTAEQLVNLEQQGSGGDSAGWTHYMGHNDGRDRMSIRSRGWVGLYF